MHEEQTNKTPEPFPTKLLRGHCHGNAKEARISARQMTEQLVCTTVSVAVPCQPLASYSWKMITSSGLIWWLQASDRTPEAVITRFAREDRMDGLTPSNLTVIFQPFQLPFLLKGDRFAGLNSGRRNGKG